jgi:hypothetical protein
MREKEKTRRKVSAIQTAGQNVRIITTSHVESGEGPQLISFPTVQCNSRAMSNTVKTHDRHKFE